MLWIFNLVIRCRLVVVCFLLLRPTLFAENETEPLSSRSLQTFPIFSLLTGQYYSFHFSFIFIFLISSSSSSSSLQVWISQEKTIWSKIRCEHYLICQVCFPFLFFSLILLNKSCYSSLQKMLFIISLKHWSIMTSLVKIMELKSCTE